MSSTQVDIEAALKQSCGKGFPIAWTLAFIVIVIGIIILIILYVRLGTVKIDPSACPNIQGEFGVKPSTKGQVLQLCGKDGMSLCTSQQPSISAAIQSCDMQFNICSGFTYDQSGNFSIIDTNGSLTATTPDVNTYIRQIQISSTS